MLLWLIALHIIFMTTWFAGIFYLPRLFVYHALCEDAIGNARFKVMERKLFYGIMTPGAVITVLLGIMMVLLNPAFYLHAPWFHAKITCVLLLLLYHFYCGVFVKRFKEDRNKKSHVYYRWFNEIPVVLIFAIVILVVVKPAW